MLLEFGSLTGLHYNYHRYYDPKTGRYLTPDPIGLAGGDYTQGKKGKGGRCGAKPIIGGILGFIGNMADPLDAISGELAGPEYDMIQLPESDSPSE